MSTLTKVTKNTFLYTFSSFLQRASSIIFYPIFSFYLSSGDYGIQSIIANITQFLILFGGLGLTGTATRLINEGDRTERIKKIYGTYILTLLIVNFALAALVFMIGPFVLNGILNDIPFNPYVTYTLMSLPFVASYSLFRNYLQATHQGVKYVKVDILYFVSNVSLNLLFVIQYKMGAGGLLLSTVISSALFSGYSYFSFYRFTYLKIDKKILYEGLIFSLPLIPYILLGVLQESTDKIILNSKMGKSVSGIFYISTMIATLFNVFRESCSQALMPWFFEKYQKIDTAYVKKVLYATFAGMSIMAIGLSWFSYEILITLSNNKELIAAFKYTPVIVSGALVIFLSQIYSMPILFYKTNTRYLFLSTLIGWPVNVALCYILIDKYGPMGAALSNLGSMCVLTFVNGFLATKSGFRINHLNFVLMIALSMCASLFALVEMNFWLLLGIKITASFIMIALYYLYLNKNFNIKEVLVEKLNPVFAFLKIRN